MEVISNLCNFPSDTSIIENITYSENREHKKEVQELLNTYLNSNIVYCNECKTIPLIRFENLVDRYFYCKCEKDNDTTFTLDPKDNYIFDYNDIIKQKNNNLKCNIHEEKNYSYYCSNHGQDLCEECQKKHQCENIKNFDAEKSLLEEEMIPFIAKCLNEKITISLNSIDNIDTSNIGMSDNLKILISCIINSYYEIPCYNTIESIKNFYDKLKNINDKEKKDYEIENYIEIKSQMEYEELNDKSRNNINKIEIISKNNDILFLTKATLNNLLELNMSSNNIDNIKPLITAKFNNLEKLNLSINRLNDNMIDDIDKLNYNNLEDLNLSYNYFTQFRLFKSIEHFKQLKKFDIGSNEFTENIDDLMKDKNLEYNLQSIEELNLSIGVFSDKSIKLISKFIFEQLITLDLTSNNLTSLSFIEDLKYVKKIFESNNYKIIKNKGEYPLKKLILINNEISDISKLSSLKNLEEIKMDNNSVIINQSVNDMVENMKFLTRITLFGNKLERKSE